MHQRKQPVVPLIRLGILHSKLHPTMLVGSVIMSGHDTLTGASRSNTCPEMEGCAASTYVTIACAAVRAGMPSRHLSAVQFSAWATKSCNQIGTTHRFSAVCDREAIQKNATGLATTVGAEALGASGLVPDPPPGSDDLLLHMLYTLTGTGWGGARFRVRLRTRVHCRSRSWLRRNRAPPSPSLRGMSSSSDAPKATMQYTQCKFISRAACSVLYIKVMFDRVSHAGDSHAVTRSAHCIPEVRQCLVRLSSGPHTRGTPCSAEKQPPPPALTQACLARVRNSSDARYAVPAIGGVGQRQAEELLQHVRVFRATEPAS